MGRKPNQLYINPRKFASMNKPCVTEMISFLSCFSQNQLKDEKCARHKELLTECINGQNKQSKKAFGNINYHLMKLNKVKK